MFRCSKSFPRADCSRARLHRSSARGTSCVAALRCTTRREGATRSSTSPADLCPAKNVSSKKIIFAYSFIIQPIRWVHKWAQCQRQARTV